MRRTVFVLLWLLVSLPARAAWAADIVPLAELARSGRVLLLRHAYAPGTGDPAQFRLDDCATSTPAAVPRHPRWANG
jgi:hypothetical protein